jgi:ATP-dependent Clp protease ATP-binding subunit ClpC
LGIPFNLLTMFVSLLGGRGSTTMFERYTEKARRVIFFARYEASQFGSPYIETEHLLLGLLREDKALTHRFLRSHGDVEGIRRQIEEHTVVREKVSTSVDLPLRNEGKRVLQYAAEEAEALSHKHIGTEHLLLGLLRDEKSFAAELLHERGVRLAMVREELRRTPAGAETRRAPAGEAPLAEFSIDMTQQANMAELPPIVGREAEIQRLIQVLGRSTKANAVLVGERGVGRRTIVAALAQRIAQGEAPSFLAHKAVVDFDLTTMVGARRTATLDFAKRAAAELMSSPDTIYFVPELHSLLLAPPEKSWLSVTEFLKTALLGDKVQCISTATAEEHRLVTERHPWLLRCFTEIPVPPSTDEEAMRILSARKDRFEKHHSVSYTDEALRFAVIYSNLYSKHRALPDKALDLLDEAGAYLRSQTSTLPAEVIELRKKIRLIVRRMEDSIANHEFEKARFYSDQEREEREALHVLEGKLGIDTGAISTVARETVEEVVASWTGLPKEKIRASGDNARSGSKA